DEARRGLLIELVEARARKGVRIGLDDQGRALRLVLVAVRDEDAVRRLAGEESEGVERTGGAHPGKIIRPEIEARLQSVGEGIAEARIAAVGGDDQIGVEDRGVEWRRFGLIADVHAEGTRPPRKNFQQRGAGAAAKPVAANAVGRAAEMNLDIVPIGKTADDGAVAFAVIGLESIERL